MTKAWALGSEGGDFLFKPHQFRSGENLGTALSTSEPLGYHLTFLGLSSTWLKILSSSTFFVIIPGDLIIHFHDNSTAWPQSLELFPFDTLCVPHSFAKYRICG